MPAQPGSGRLPTDDAAVLAALRRRRPLVHCLTNTVAATLTANVLLAVGASPAMVEDPEETSAFTPQADAVLVNLGTLLPARAAAMSVAIHAARDAGIPWVLDPVAVGAIPSRARFAHELLTGGPAVVRGNASEVAALDGAVRSGRGPDSTIPPSAAAAVATVLARQYSTTVAVSGVIDFITDGTRTGEVHSGHRRMTQVTGIGCALGALVAACCTVAPPFEAALAATGVLTRAAELAAGVSDGPGTFVPHLLDVLAGGA